MESLSKQELRIKETRVKLLDAAEKVFVRDGYENAQLDEIASLAGRSKGAVYTHFKNKEDLFLLLFENRSRAYLDRLALCVRKDSDQNRALDDLRNFYVGLVTDHTWPILTLEFKLFALRRPESIAKYHSALAASKPPTNGLLHEQLFGHVSGSGKTRNALSQTALGPIIAALILESVFEPKILTEKALRQLLTQIFDSLFSKVQ